MNMEKQAKNFVKSAKSNWSKAKRKYVCRSLKDLIRAYRACTTRSEERALVKKEAAHIRDLFREGDKVYRRQNIAKLLFFHMNGYPTDFGMTECIKLCASSKYSDKRVAYLGLMILVDETEEILMLMTNSLKQDLNSGDLHIVSLALNVLGDIASVEMVRDLLPEIEKHLVSNNSYILKKAALAAVRAVRKLPSDETTNIMNSVPTLFEAKAPAVQISGTALITEFCKQGNENLTELQAVMTPVLVNILRDHLLAKGGSRGTPGSFSETVIGGVRNPLLQVKVISAIRALVESGIRGDVADSISDVLAQVAANTDGAKVPGCAVLYECVKTIIVLDTEKSLRELAVNILGTFLSHKEATVRYIALQELTRVVDIDGPLVLKSVDGHKEKILAGMREADPTVRKRAVELAYRVANESNITEMVQEILSYIEKSASPEAKEDGCWKVFLLLDKYGPSDEWKVETFVKALSCADMSMPEELITSFIALVSSKPHVQPHAVRVLFSEALVTKSAAETHTRSIDPFSSGQQNETKSNGHGAGGKDHSQKKRPRLQRVAVYMLGEYGETAPSVGLDIPEVLEAFEQTLVASEAPDEAWMNTYETSFHEENKILGEVALTGLVKFAARALGNSGAASGFDAATDPLLAITGTPSQAEQASAILALPAPNQGTKAEDHGLGTDLLASMGLGDDSAKPQQGGGNKALVPTSNALTVPHVQSGTGALMSFESDAGSSSGNPVVARVRQILLARARSSELEIQQRACEYLMLLNDSMLPSLVSTMASMPPLDFQSIQERAKQKKELRSAKTYINGSNRDGLLLDLLGDAEAPLGLPAAGGDFLALPSSSAPAAATDLTLEDILGGSGSSSGAGPAAQTQDVDLASLGMSSKAPEAKEAVLHPDSSAMKEGLVCSTTVYESEELRVHADFFKDESGEDGNARIELLFTNKSNFAMSNFVFLLAVPNYIKLQMHPASAAFLPVGGEATQGVNLMNSLHGQKPVKLRYRVQYNNESSGVVAQQQGVVAGLDAL